MPPGIPPGRPRRRRPCLASPPGPSARVHPTRPITEPLRFCTKISLDFFEAWYNTPSFFQPVAGVPPVETLVFQFDRKR
jgi:hypothetical protein